jgi:hypothetical protein
MKIPNKVLIIGDVLSNLRKGYIIKRIQDEEN